jgi:hypothetical protein
MSVKLNWIHAGCTFLALAAWLGVLGTAACSSSNDRPVIVRIEPPSQPAPMPVSPAEPMSVSSAEPMPVSSAEPTSDASPATPDERPVDERIFDDFHPWPRALSKNVPDRACADDGECGDGFCDRGRCAAIWSWSVRYGQRCVNGKAAHISDYVPDECDGICLAGRCRSCVSDAECVKYRRHRYAKCIPTSDTRGRHCGIDDPNSVPSIVPPN